MIKMMYVGEDDFRGYKKNRLYDVEIHTDMDKIVLTCPYKGNCRYASISKLSKEWRSVGESIVINYSSHNNDNK